MESRAALISIHPEHVERIFSGAKKIEFRRRWTVDQWKLYLYTPLLLSNASLDSRR